MTRDEAIRILGVDIYTTGDELKKIYRDKCIIFHPDKNPDDPNASNKFILIKEAYEWLDENPYSETKDRQDWILSKAERLSEQDMTPAFEFCFGEQGKVVQGLFGVFADSIRNKSKVDAWIDETKGFFKKRRKKK